MTEVSVAVKRAAGGSRGMRDYRELVAIAKAGGSIVVPPEKTYKPAELLSIAHGVKEGGGKLIIQDAHRYASEDLVRICQAAPTQVYVYE